MRYFKEDDGLFDKVSKLVTIFGVMFGAWAYFHTIHPVFEKELELGKLKGEASQLRVEKEELRDEIAHIQSVKASLEKNVRTLEQQELALKNELFSKERILREVVANLKDAADTAVLNKLQYYSDKIISAYLLAVMSGKESSFDPVVYSRTLLESHSDEKGNSFDKQAYEYFSTYVKQHEGKSVKGDKVVEFAVTLFFDYKIGLLKAKSTQAE